jgi:predicted site-specific integrase-resolvase
MKLSKWAKKQGLCYQTAWNMYKKNLIPNAYQLLTGTIIVEDIPNYNININSAAIYARVSNAENRPGFTGLKN